MSQLNPLAENGDCYVLRTDNSYLGMLTDQEIIERANYYPTADLCVALAYRLKEASHAAIRRLRDEINDLEAALSEAEDERDELQAENDELVKQVEELEAQQEAEDRNRDES